MTLGPGAALKSYPDPRDLWLFQVLSGYLRLLPDRSPPALQQHLLKACRPACTKICNCRVTLISLCRRFSKVISRVRNPIASSVQCLADRIKRERKKLKTILITVVCADTKFEANTILQSLLLLLVLRGFTDTYLLTIPKAAQLRKVSRSRAE